VTDYQGEEGWTARRRVGSGARGPPLRRGGVPGPPSPPTTLCRSDDRLRGIQETEGSRVGSGGGGEWGQGPPLRGGKGVPDPLAANNLLSLTRKSEFFSSLSLAWISRSRLTCSATYSCLGGSFLADRGLGMMHAKMV